MIETQESPAVQSDSQRTAHCPRTIGVSWCKIWLRGRLALCSCSFVSNCTCLKRVNTNVDRQWEGAVLLPTPTAYINYTGRYMVTLQSLNVVYWVYVNKITLNYSMLWTFFTYFHNNNGQNSFRIDICFVRYLLEIGNHFFKYLLKDTFNSGREIFVRFQIGELI